MKQFFLSNNKLSMMRLLSFLCICNAIFLSIWGILHKLPLSELSIICGTFLTAGIGGKFLQNKDEKSLDTAIEKKL